MLKHLPICILAVALVGLFDFSQGTVITSQLYPSCTNTGFFHDFSYAKGVFNMDGSWPCSGLNNNHETSAPMIVTWFYYDTYPVPAGGCVNPPPLPTGDQCCHSTATSTIIFYATTFLNVNGTVVGTQTGIVTAGTFQGHSATYVLTKSNLLNNCDTLYGQEAAVGTASLTIAGGPVCLNGADFEEYCPGHH